MRLNAPIRNVCYYKHVTSMRSCNIELLQFILQFNPSLSPFTSYALSALSLDYPPHPIGARCDQKGDNGQGKEQMFSHY